METKKNKIHGFTEKDRKYVKEIDGEAILFEHDKTGAQLLFIKNDDNNRVFTIGFSTPSNNSTGVAHIIEHSTLCGSEKYPVKEPFVELLKGSLNTFLNAMTYSDKTLYPVASISEKDFRNLTDVYLDAVFNPNLHKNPYTFMQEGWHYHLEDKNEPLRYNGVVYNEMQGVYQDINNTISNEVLKSLYPDTIYSKDSGGNPDEIVDLTYEAFKDFHKKYYHPSNSYIFVYGDNDLDDQLEYLNSWLEKYDKEDIDVNIPLQEKFKERVEVESDYPILPTDEKLIDKDYIALNYALNEHTSPIELRALNLLIDYLLDSNASLLKKRLLEKNLAKDVSVIFDTSQRQPYISIVLKETDLKNQDEFVSTVEDTINELIENGIDEEDFLSVINSHEFRTLETLSSAGNVYPRGLLLGLGIYDNWLYGDNPLDWMNISEDFKKLKELNGSDFYTDLLKKYFIDNKHQSLVKLKPNLNLLEEIREKNARELKEYKDSLSESELNEIYEQTQKLIEEQNKVDTKEALDTIPRLKIEEIEKEVIPIDYEVIEQNGYPIIYVKNNNEIIYLNLSFNFMNIKQEDIPYLKLLEEILAEVSTKNYDYEKLNKEFDRYTGGINTDLSVSSKLETEEIIPRLMVKISTKEENLQKTIELLDEVINNSFFTEKKLIQDVISSIRITKKLSIEQQGNAMAKTRLQANLSDAARLFEEIHGINFYRFIQDLSDNFDERWDDLSARLIRLAVEVFNINNLIVSVACREEELDKVVSEIDKLANKFNKDEIKQEKYEFDVLDNTEAFKTAGNINYNAKGGKVNLDELNVGALRVMQTILAMDYLWNKVRVLGGAYGVNLNIDRTGQIVFSSFRDPNLDETYDNYDSSVEYIKNLDLSKDEIDKYIIGTISSLDHPLSTKQKLLLATEMYLIGLTDQKRQEDRDKVLNVTLEELKETAETLEDILKQGYYVTIGSGEKIDNNQTSFENVEYVD